VDYDHPRWVTRLNAHGIPYECAGRDDDVPGIPRQWLDAIVYLYPSDEAADSGAPYGASGFLMTVDPAPGLPPASGHLYVVTNAHVIEGGCDVLRVNTHAGHHYTMPMSRDGWFLHPDGDDLALAPLGLNKALLRYTYVPFEMAVPKVIMDDGHLGIGDEAFFIGRYVYRDGRASNTPAARFGAIAQVGGDPIFQKERGFRQESILVEAHSLSGFSGSPVFAYRGARFAPAEGDPNRASIIPQVGTRVYLLGVDWGSDPWTADVLDKGTHEAVEPGQYVQASSGMSMIVPAWKLRGALDHPDLVRFREIRETLMREVMDQPEYAGNAQMDTADVEPMSQAEPTIPATEDLMRRLLDVPKDEADEVHRGHQS